MVARESAEDREFHLRVKLVRNFEMEIMKCPLANKLLKKLGTLVRFHDGIIAP